jgi:hypothetical protein
LLADPLSLPSLLLVLPDPEDAELSESELSDDSVPVELLLSDLFLLLLAFFSFSAFLFRHTAFPSLLLFFSLPFAPSAFLLPADFFLAPPGLAPAIIPIPQMCYTLQFIIIIRIRIRIPIPDLYPVSIPTSTGTDTLRVPLPLRPIYLFAILTGTLPASKLIC